LRGRKGQVDAFNRNHDDGKFDEIYAAANETFKNRIDLQAMSQNLGAALKSEGISRWSLQSVSGTGVPVPSIRSALKGRSMDMSQLERIVVLCASGNAGRDFLRTDIRLE